jgi:hypothetical protein
MKTHFLFKRTFFASFVLSVFALGAQAQTATTPAQGDKPQTDEKAEAVLKRALEAVGGRAFLDVRAVVSEGYFTPFKDGVGTVPIKFVDYLVFPDKDRTEFRGAGVRSIETHVGDGGWIADVKKRTLADVTPEQAAEFRVAIRTSLDNVLRGWWRAEGARLTYVGRREAGLARRNDAVRLAYPDGFTVEFEFDAKTAAPAKAVFKRRTAEGDETDEEDRYAQLLNISGVSVPFIIDHFRAGLQSSRVNYERVEFRAVPDALFARPSDVKALK